MNKMKVSLNKKIIIIGLTISVFVMGTFTSFAYFTDKRDTNANISIFMGKLDIDIIKPIHIKGLDIDKSVSDSFTIENNGTLEQKIDFRLDNKRNIEADGLDKLNFELIFKKDNEVVSKLYNGKLASLFLGPINIVNENNEIVILSKDETLIGDINITMDKTMPSKYSNADISFDMVMTANQVNKPMSN